MKYFNLFCLIPFIIGCQFNSKHVANNRKSLCITNMEFPKERIEYFECRNDADVILNSGFIRQDSITVFENISYYKSGKINEYKFYDPRGTLRFFRSYNKEGVIIEESGDFLSHDQIESSVLQIGDSIKIKIFIANPPNTSFTVYGIDRGERYLLKPLKTSKTFIFIALIVVKVSGEFVFPYEVDFIDQQNNLLGTSGNQLTFSVF